MTRDATTSEEKSSRSYWGFVLWPLTILLLYALSFGPLLLLYSKGLINHKFANIYTRPLDFLFEAPLYRMYLHLWVPNYYDIHGEIVHK